MGPAALVTGAMVLVLTGTVPGIVNAQQSAPATALVFDGVTVIDVVRGKLLPRRRVVVQGARIQAVGRAGAVRIPQGARVVDARGKYLMPGLWDMHVHLDSSAVRPPTSVSRRGDNLDFYKGFIAHGVTGIRTMSAAGATLDSVLESRRKILAGERVGPRVIAAGGRVGEWMGEGRRMVNTLDDARQVVDSLKAAGADFLKIYAFQPGEGVSWASVFFALAAEARRVGLPFGGHAEFPSGITPAQASDSGERTFEHANSAPEPCKSWRGSTDTATEKACATLARRMMRNGTWFTPTLAILCLTRMSPCGENDSGSIISLTRMMHRAGIPMLTGTDVNDIYKEGPLGSFEPGPSLHEELQLLVQSGLTPLEALRAATLNPALAFKLADSLGAVAPGKLADVVLLDADPLADIANTTKIRAVVANGRYFDRAALDQLAAEARARTSSRGKSHENP